MATFCQNMSCVRIVGMVFCMTLASPPQPVLIPDRARGSASKASDEQSFVRDDGQAVHINEFLSITANVYSDAPSVRGWSGQHSDAELLIVDHGTHPAFAFGLAIDVTGRSWRTSFCSRVAIERVLEQLAAGEPGLRSSELRFARRIVAGFAETRDGRTPLQNELVRAGLGDEVARSAGRASQKSLEYSLAAAAADDWPVAVTTMVRSLGSALDGFAAGAGELWPGQRWRLHRLRCVGPALAAVGSSVDDVTGLLMLEGLDRKAPQEWFDRASRLVHNIVAEIGDTP